MKHDVIVVGAGLAGLTAARYLAQSDLDVLVLESSDRPGGRVKSDKIDGFTLDHGFQVINPKYPEVVASGVLKDCDFHSMPAGFRIVDGNRSQKLTIGNAINSPGSVKQKLALLGFLGSKASNTLSLGEVAAKFPTLFAEVLEPFLRGVFLTEPKHVASDVAQKILRSFVFGRPGLPRAGIGVFSAELAKVIPAIRYESVVQEVSARGVITDTDTLEADFVVVATDPTTAHQLIHGRLMPEVLPSATWYHTSEDKLSDSHLLAAQKSGVIVNSVVLSSVMPSYAPAGRMLVASTTILPTSESDVRRELAHMWKTSTHGWELLAKYEIKQSLPFHRVGKPIYSEQHVEGGIYIAGDHCAYPSQQGAMESGKMAAEEIIRRVRSKR